MLAAHYQRFFQTTVQIASYVNEPSLFFSRTTLRISFIDQWLLKWVAKNGLNPSSVVDFLSRAGSLLLSCTQATGDFPDTNSKFIWKLNGNVRGTRRAVENKLNKLSKIYHKTLCLCSQTCQKVFGDFNQSLKFMSLNVKRYIDSSRCKRLIIPFLNMFNASYWLLKTLANHSCTWHWIFRRSKHSIYSDLIMWKY